MPCHDYICLKACLKACRGCIWFCQNLVPGLHLLVLCSCLLHLARIQQCFECGKLEQQVVAWLLSEPKPYWYCWAHDCKATFEIISPQDHLKHFETISRVKTCPSLTRTQLLWALSHTFIQLFFAVRSWAGQHGHGDYRWRQGGSGPNKWSSNPAVHVFV